MCIHITDYYFILKFLWILPIQIIGVISVSWVNSDWNNSLIYLFIFSVPDAQMALWASSCHFLLTASQYSLKTKRTLAFVHYLPSPKHSFSLSIFLKIQSSYHLWSDPWKLLQLQVPSCPLQYHKSQQILGFSNTPRLFSHSLVLSLNALFLRYLCGSLLLINGTACLNTMSQHSFSKLATSTSSPHSVSILLPCLIFLKRSWLETKLFISFPLEMWGL